jgi:hypothetical protein
VSLLKLAGVSSACVAALHLLVIFVGGPAYRYFGAGEQMARMAEQGSPTPALVTAGLTLLFAVWAAYAFSGAGLLRRLPLLRTGLVVIGIIYALRGLLLLPEVAWILSGRTPPVQPRQPLFSLGALVTGLAYLIGTQRAWGVLHRRGLPGQM